MSCLNIEIVERYASGRLAQAEQSRVTAHLASCDACRQQLDDVRENMRAAEQIAQARADAASADVTVPSPGGAGVTASIPPLQPSATAVIPGYDVVREISRGGQGVVYQAIQKSTKRKVALKVLREGHFASAAERARFQREVEILGQLKHPNIVSIYDSGTVGGNAYYVMDYVSGVPLDEYVAKSENRKSKSEIRDLLSLFAKVCDAVHAAHVRGIIHRDLKPSNIRIDADGEPRVLDFGLAKVAGAAELSQSPAMTITGQFLGSLPWSSPEQAEGIPSKIDIRTDVYSLGVLLYQLLTGRFPYEVTGNMCDVLDRILTAEPARPSTIHRRINDELETIALKCLAKDRERRYQSAGDIARDVHHYLAGEPILAKRDSAWYLVRKLAMRYKLTSVVILSVTCILVAWGATSFWLWQRERQSARKAEQSALERARDWEQATRAAFAATLVEGPRMALGWFLAEWQAGRLNRAREIYERVRADAPERAAMAFLLDENRAPDDLLAALPANAALAHFVIGERYLAAGQPEEALRAFVNCVAARDDDWIHAAAQARIAQLRSGAEKPNPGPTPEEKLP